MRGFTLLETVLVLAILATLMSIMIPVGQGTVEWARERCGQRLIKERTKAEALVTTLRQCLEAFHFTREYVGEALLPAIPGWTWYDAKLVAEVALADWDRDRASGPVATPTI